jgi:hypothetical protein
LRFERWNRAIAERGESLNRAFLQRLGARPPPSADNSTGVIVFHASARPRGSRIGVAPFREPCRSRRALPVSRAARWDSKLVPRTRIDHQDRTVGIFDDIRRMKVEAVRDDEIGITALERRAARLERVARHLVQVEERSEEVVRDTPSPKRAEL